MTATEMVIVARLASHYEYAGVGKDAGDDGALKAAHHDVRKIKKEAPELWQLLYDDSSLSDREIGDLLYRLMLRHAESGMSFKNFAADEFDAMTTKRTPRKNKRKRTSRRAR